LVTQPIARCNEYLCLKVFWSFLGHIVVVLTSLVRMNEQYDLWTAMKNYSSLPADKSRIDRMQMNFKCCGSRDFKDWWNIEWCTMWVNADEIIVSASFSLILRLRSAIFTCVLLCD